jgi:AsmA protein
LPGPFENFQLSAQASLGPQDIQLSGLRLFADGNEFAGSLALRRDGDRPSLRASLTSDFVSLKSMLADAPPLVAADGQWNRDPFDLPDLAHADVDLRLSAAHARLGRLAIDDGVLSLTLRDGRLELALTEARAYKGVLKARATFAPAPGGALEVHASAQTIGVDAGALLWDVSARQNFAGALDSTLTLDTTGDSLAALMRDLDGRASLVLTEGEITGVNLERALSRLDKRPLSSALDIRSGSSSLDRATATIKIAKGTASVEEGAARGPGFALAFAGSARVSERSLALKALANEADGAGKPREKGLQISFDISGSWDEPNVTPDAKALIKRSGAAAPLLPRSEPQPPTESEGKDR